MSYAIINNKALPETGVKMRGANAYPLALHPSTRSFDLQLNGLLANKVDLSDAVVAAANVEAKQLADCF